MTIELDVLIGVIVFALSAAGFFIGRQSAAKSDGKRDGALDAKMEYLKTSIDEIKVELKESNLLALKMLIDSQGAAIEKHSESIRRLHDRLDAHVQTEHKKAGG